MTDLIQEAQSPETTHERLLEIAEEASEDVETLLEIFRNPNCADFEEVLEVLDEDVADSLIEAIREKLEENIEAASEEEDADIQLLVAAFSNAHCSTIEEILEDILEGNDIQLMDAGGDVGQELKQTLIQTLKQNQFERFQSILKATSLEDYHSSLQWSIAANWVIEDPIEILHELIRLNDGDESRIWYSGNGGEIAGHYNIRNAIANNQAVPKEILTTISSPGWFTWMAKEASENQDYDNLMDSYSVSELIESIAKNPNSTNEILCNLIDCLQDLTENRTSHGLNHRLEESYTQSTITTIINHPSFNQNSADKIANLDFISEENIALIVEKGFNSSEKAEE